MTKPPFLLAACSLCMSLALQQAQAQSSAGDARRAIEDSTTATKRLSLEKQSKTDHELSAAIADLADVEVLGPSPLAPLVKRYWQRFIGKPVTKDTLSDFKLWFAEESRKEGTLAFAFAERKVAADGRETLVLTLTSPRIQSLQLLIADTSLAEKYRDLLASRLSEYFSAGAWLDIDGLDQHLDRISFDLPLNLEATVRPVGPQTVDLLVSCTAIDTRAGALKRLLLQANNHGLKQFGRAQVVGQLTVGGLTPHASANVATLLSDGIEFLSADYETLMPVLSGRLRISGSYSGSKNINAGDAATRGSSKEIGIGLTRQESNWGDLIIRSNTEISTRRSVNTLLISNTITGDIKDEQFRFSLSMDNERVRRFPLAANFTVSAGHLTPSAVDTVAGGRYYKLSTHFSSSHPITLDGRWYSVFKSQAQLVSRGLDSYNKASIGGNQGVRSYTSADGVGDAGAAGSLEINHLSGNGIMTGLFYDFGRVKPNKTLSAGAFNENYSLQAIGLQFAGSWGNWKYNGHFAKGLGGYKLADSQPSAAESKANPFKFALTVSHSF